MTLKTFLKTHAEVVHIRLTDVKGSSPRDIGAEMFVAADKLYGTIGGGRLEYLVINRARTMIHDGIVLDDMDISLGPEIGQCCGGRVAVNLRCMDDNHRTRTIALEDERISGLPHVYILGAGHVGRALAVFLQTLPVHCIMVDSRADELALTDAKVEKRQSALPEADISAAPEGSVFVVLTHDHALDFLLASAALARGDAAYVGLIGSRTKRIKFERYCRKENPEISTAPLVCPIGMHGSADKRPEVIAAFVAAEVMARLPEAKAR